MYAAFPGRQRALPPLLSSCHPGRRWCVPKTLLGDLRGGSSTRLLRDSLALQLPDSLALQLPCLAAQLPCLPTQLPGLAEQLPGHQILSSGRPPH